MDDKKLQQFLDDLTAVSRKHGLVINPDGDLFEMEAEDYKLKYACDDNSHLDR